LKKLLVALGLGSALIITPALAQNSDQSAPAGASAPADASAPAKPMKHKAKKATHHKAKAKKAAPDAAPADPNAPK
jgi:hypothetical protein